MHTDTTSFKQINIIGNIMVTELICKSTIKQQVLLWHKMVLFFVWVDTGCTWRRWSPAAPNGPTLTTNWQGQSTDTRQRNQSVELISVNGWLALPKTLTMFIQMYSCLSQSKRQTTVKFLHDKSWACRLPHTVGCYCRPSWFVWCDNAMTATEWHSKAGNTAETGSFHVEILREMGTLSTVIP